MDAEFRAMIDEASWQMQADPERLTEFIESVFVRLLFSALQLLLGIVGTRADYSASRT